MSVRSWFANLWTSATGAIGRFFEGPGGAVVRQALGSVIEQAGAIGTTMLLNLAKSKVSMLNTTNLTNAAKRTEALDYLKGYAIKEGIVAGESVLRYILETAVSAVKGQTPKL